MFVWVCVYVHEELGIFVLACMILDACLTLTRSLCGSMFPRHVDALFAVCTSSMKHDFVRQRFAPGDLQEERWLATFGMLQTPERIYCT